MIDDALERVRREGEGVKAVVLSGFDGMVVASAGDEGVIATDAVAAAFADLFRKLVDAHRDAGLPPPQELAAGGPEGRIVIRAVTDDYLLLAVLGERGIAGRTRFALSKAAALLESELS